LTSRRLLCISCCWLTDAHTDSSGFCPSSAILEKIDVLEAKAWLSQVVQLIRAKKDAGDASTVKRGEGCRGSNKELSEGDVIKHLVCFRLAAASGESPLIPVAFLNSSTLSTQIFINRTQMFWYCTFPIFTALAIRRLPLIDRFHLADGDESRPLLTLPSTCSPMASASINHRCHLGGSRTREDMGSFKKNA
jgi:hypothetical protein